MTKIEKRACAFLVAVLMSVSIAVPSFAETVYAEEIAMETQGEKLPGIETNVQDVPEVLEVSDEAEQPENVLEEPEEEAEEIAAEEKKEDSLLEETGETEEKEAEVKDSEAEKETKKAASAKEKNANEGKAGDWSYQVINEAGKTAAITDYTGSSSVVSIPSVLTVQTDTGEVKYQVVEIGEQAFSEKKGVSEVVIPKTVTVLQYKSFSGSSLKKVSFETGSVLNTVGESAFYGSSLESIILPERVQTIGKNAFAGSALSSIRIPDKVKIIQSGTFGNCEFLSSVTLGAGISEIGESAFGGCESLKGINLPSGLRMIGDYAFSGSGLTAITIPDSVTTVGDGAFRRCAALTDVKVGNGLTYIPASAFGESGVKNINFGNKVKTIGDYAFSRNKSLTRLVLPSNVTDLQYKTFADCTNLTSITLPDTIENLSGENFSGTAWYNKQPNGDVYLGKVFYQYKGTMSANTTLKVRNGTRCIAGFACAQQANLKSVELPEGLVSIGYAAFMETGLKSVRIPESVTRIDEGALGYIRGESVSFKYIDDSPEPYRDKLHQVDKDFTIYGYPGTAAESYAKKNGIRFSELKWDISKCNISGIETSYIYTGKNIVPKIQVKRGSVKVPASDYTVSCKNNKKVGKATITITGKNTLSGKVTRTFTIQPKLTVSKTKYTKTMGAKAFNLNAKASGSAKLKYKSSNNKVAAVKNGKVSVKGTGKAVITVGASENGISASKKINITVKPAKMAAPSVKAKKKTITVSWKKASGIAGYEIQYSTSKKFTSGTTKSKVIKKASVCQKKISGLKAKTYYVRIRACGRDNLKGSFSKVKTVKVKGK